MNRILHFCLPLLASPLVCFLLLFASETVSAGQDEANRILRSRMPREIQRFARQFQSGSITIDADNTSRYQAGAKKHEGSTRDLIKKHGQFYVIKVEQQGGDKTLEFCYGINSRYCFELLKNKAGNAWVVSKVPFVTPDFDDTKQGFFLHISGVGFRRLVDNYVSGLTSVYMAHGIGIDGGISPENLFDLPGFQLNSVALDETNQNLLKANFSYELTDTETKKQCHSDCIVEFDLGLHCLPTKLHQSYKTGTKEVIHDWQREWVKTGDDSYTVKRSVDTKTLSNSVAKHLIRIRSDMRINTRDLPETDFTLSTFGFPEPPGVEWNKPFPWYLVLAGVGTASLGVFFFLRSRAKRLRGVS